MIAVDTNILVYAHREDSPFHETACSRIEALASGPGDWAIPWPCLHEFYAIVTHPRVFDPPTSTTQALEQVEAWLESPTLQLIGEGMHHWTTLTALLHDAKIAGPRVHDARIAAICMQHGVDSLWSADRDFSAFPGLRVANPCVAA